MTTLQALAKRYPLTYNEKSSPSRKELLVTVAIHAEIKRRDDGGKENPHIRSIRDLAEEIIERGYQQTSKHYSAEMQVNKNLQSVLARTKDLLRQKCRQLPDADLNKNATIIFANGIKNSDDDAFAPMTITDDEIPF